MLSVVGRNGMGKTTLCKTIMGLVRASSGSIRMNGQDLTSLQPAQIARLGIGYVPQGRRLWRSLSVDEHLRLSVGRRRGPGASSAIYDTFPRLAERKNNGGGQLSGGEQQMLAISRALLTNPQLLIMDEPTEGLAPVIVTQVEEMLVQARRGRRHRHPGHRAEYRRRDFGVRQGRDHGQWPDQPHHRLAAARVPTVNCSSACSASAAIPMRAPEAEDNAADATRRGSRAGSAGQCRAGAHLHLQSDPADALVAAGSRRAHRSRPRAPPRAVRPGSTRRRGTVAATVATLSGGPPAVLVVGTLDTKGPELRFIRDLVKASGLRTRLVDVSTSGKPATTDVTAQEIALNHPRGGARVFNGERGASVDRDGRSVRGLDQAAGRRRRHHQRRRLRRRLDRRARHARAADRRAEGAGFVGRLRRCRPLCRPRATSP